MVVCSEGTPPAPQSLSLFRWHGHESPVTCLRVSFKTALLHRARAAGLSHLRRKTHTYPMQRTGLEKKTAAVWLSLGPPQGGHSTNCGTSVPHQPRAGHARISPSRTLAALGKGSQQITHPRGRWAPASLVCLTLVNPEVTGSPDGHAQANAGPRLLVTSASNRAQNCHGQS